MGILQPLLFLILFIDGIFMKDDHFPSLEADSLLVALESEVTRTLRSQLATDEELQYIEGSASDEGLTPLTTTTTTTTTTTSTTIAPQTCVPLSNCFTDSDCVDGKCLGSQLATCDCNACITNKFCVSDKDCGGLINSCDSTTHLCDCVQAFHSHGYQLFVKVLLTFCQQKKCTTTSDNCYGLPCRTGSCTCSPQVASNQPVHYFTGR